MSEITSPYSLGARRGLTLGVALCIMFLATVYSTRVALAGVLGAAIFVWVPLWIYRVLRRTYVDEGGMTTLSGLWMQGIMIFACGSVVCALFSSVYMKWIEPRFVIDTLTHAIEIYRSLDGEQAAQAAEMLQRIIDAHAVPTASAIAMEMVWLSIFSGSMLSLVMALLARIGKVPDKNSNIKTY